MSKTSQDKKNLIFFPMGTIGRDMVYCLISSFLLNYIMFTRHLTNAQLAAVTGIMVFARLFDAFNDPIMGNIIEGTRTKWGKFKPWQLIGCVTTAFVVYFTYNSSLDGWSFIIFFGVMYILFSITFTMSDISYWGMVPALSSDADTRNQITSRATLFAGIGGTAISVFVPMLTAGENAIGGDAKTAYGIIALIVGIATPLFILFTIFGAKEKNVAVADSTPKTKVSFKKIFSTIGGNDQLLWIAVIFLVQQIGSNIVLNGIGSTYIYFKFGYDGGKYSLFTTIGMMATALLMVFYPMISRRVNRKPLMGFMMIVSTVGYILMFLSGVVPMGEIGYYVLVVGYMLGNFGCYSYYLIMMISIMNTVEYNELKRGSRDEGIITSLRPFITKLASALVVIITSAVYMVLNVTKYTNQISEWEQKANAGEATEEQKIAAITKALEGVQPNETIGLLLFISLVPLVLMFISYVLYKKKYKLDEDVYEDICKQLEAKKN